MSLNSLDAVCTASNRASAALPTVYTVSGALMHMSAKVHSFLFQLSTVTESCRSCHHMNRGKLEVVTGCWCRSLRGLPTSMTHSAHVPSRAVMTHSLTNHDTQCDDS